MVIRPPERPAAYAEAQDRGVQNQSSGDNAHGNLSALLQLGLSLGASLVSRSQWKRATRLEKGKK